MKTEDYPSLPMPIDELVNTINCSPEISTCFQVLPKVTIKIQDTRKKSENAN